jgi:hypothetical protein
MAVKRLTELDFDGIKTNLKTYLQAQDQYADYDFEASGLSVLIDLLAYNTQYNAFLAHMVSNEAFLDSAVKRNSVASIAKTMGYTARSARAARATINLTIVPSSTYNSGSLTISNRTAFTASLNGKTFKFYPITDYTVNKTLDDAGIENFVFTDIIIAEGSLVDNSQIIAAGNEQGPVLMANPDVDTTTVTCDVQDSISSSDTTTFTFSENILNVTPTSNIFYVEEALNGNYQIRFGDDVIGKKLTIGNIVRLTYLATQGANANGASSFTPPSQITGVGETITLTVVSASAGGSAQESVDSIRFNAPRFNATKNRAVTANDYQALVLASNPNIKSVAVWGGEDNDPPIYGKVFVSLQAKPGTIITQDDKDTILRETIEPRQPVSITTDFVDPEFTYIGLNVNVSYDSKKTTITQGALKELVDAEISNYFDTELNSLDKNFYYSVLTSRIVGVSNSFVAVNLEQRLTKRTTPFLNVDTKYTLPFNNKINPRSVTSNYFVATINGATYSVYLTDVPEDTVVPPAYNGVGRLVLKTTDRNIVVDNNAGTVDYDTGRVVVNSLNISSISGSITDLRVSVIPHESAKDIKTEVLKRTSDDLTTTSGAVVPLPSKNIILINDTSSADIPNNIRAGLVITMTPKISD